MKVVKISAIWCPACLIMNNRINKLKDKYNLDIIEYDYDIDEYMIEEYSVGKTLPVIFDHAAEVRLGRLPFFVCVGAAVRPVAPVIGDALHVGIQHPIVALQHFGFLCDRSGLAEHLAGFQNADAIKDFPIPPDHIRICGHLRHADLNLASQGEIVFKDCCHCFFILL